MYIKVDLTKQFLQYIKIKDGNRMVVQHLRYLIYQIHTLHVKLQIIMSKIIYRKVSKHVQSNIKYMSNEEVDKT